MKPGSKLPMIVAAAVVIAVVTGTVIMRNKGSDPRAVDVAARDDEGATRLAAPSIAAPPAARRTGAPVDRQQAHDELAEQLELRAQKREEHKARTRELREQSAARYASEQVDPAWAPGKESELNGIANREDFAQAGAKPKSLSVDCRSSMCRLDGQFESRGQAEDWVMMYMSSVGSAMPNSIVSRSQNPDGSARVEIYGRAR